mmetsp:Transcript_31432/g.100973  ORF Transcript_31432/g.100973 Transcript_31432/m.100973 type:complete len:244 (+) Transcript_31432:736-1467(+)
MAPSTAARELPAVPASTRRSRAPAERPKTKKGRGRSSLFARVVNGTTSPNVPQQHGARARRANCKLSQRRFRRSSRVGRAVEDEEGSRSIDRSSKARRQHARRQKSAPRPPVSNIGRRASAERQTDVGDGSRPTIFTLCAHNRRRDVAALAADGERPATVDRKVRRPDIRSPLRGFVAEWYGDDENGPGRRRGEPRRRCSPANKKHRDRHAITPSPRGFVRSSEEAHRSADAATSARDLSSIK